MSLANVSIVGNLTKAPQQTQFSSGKVKTTFFVAVNTPFREKRGGDAADFYKIEAWGKMAELTASYLNKGNQITVNGRLLLDRWKDDDGRERITPTIELRDIVFPRKLQVVQEYPQPAEKPESPASYTAATVLAAPAASPTVSAASSDEPSESEIDEDQEYDEDEDDGSAGGSGERDRITRPAPTRTGGGGRN